MSDNQGQNWYHITAKNSPSRKKTSRYNIDVVVLSETRLADEGQCTEAGCGCTFFWIGRPEDQPRTTVVGIAIKNSVLPKLESLSKGINERLMTLRIKLKGNQHLTFLSVYTPTLTAAP